MKALVTGGAGFIGSHIVERLLVDGHSVIVLDDFSTGKIENIPRHDKLDIIECDIRNFKDILKYMAGVDWVFHKAAVASVPKTVNDPIGSSAVNYLGTLHVLEAARINKVKRVVFASSAALYGDDPVLPKVETMLPVALSPYAVDKLASEYACGMYYMLYGLKTVCLRYFNVYGPKQDPSSPYSGVISIFVDKLSKNEAPIIYGDGEQTRDFIYISDVVEANLLAIQKENISGQVYNIATGNKTTLNDLLRKICYIYQAPFDPKYEAIREGDIRDSYARIDKAVDGLCWSPLVGLGAGLDSLVKSLRS